MWFGDRGTQSPSTVLYVRAVLAPVRMGVGTGAPEAARMKTSLPEGAESAGSVDPVAAAISRLIVDGIYGPGDRLKLGELAAKLKTGMTPVREALWKMEGSGLIQNFPNRGAVVREIDEPHIANVYDVRAAIDSMLIERCVEAATSAQIARIDAARLDVEKALRTGDPRSILRADAAFHGAINGVACNDVATEMLRRSFHLISSLRMRLGFEADRLREIAREHADIVDAIHAGDTRLAAHKVRLHINGARESMLRAFRGMKDSGRVQGTTPGTPAGSSRRGSNGGPHRPMVTRNRR